MTGLKSHSWYLRQSNFTRALTLPMADRLKQKPAFYTEWDSVSIQAKGIKSRERLPPTHA